MITVGFGDICPTTIFEKLITIILTLISCGIFAYAVVMNHINNTSLYIYIYINKYL